MSFKTQKEIYEALIEGKVLYCANSYAKMVDGMIYSKSKDKDSIWVKHTFFFDPPNLWSIYEEPKVKKLYAYRALQKDEIIFSKTDHGYSSRAPEYDIVYPEEE